MSEELGPIMVNKPDKPKSLLDRLSETPYPAWITSFSLLASSPWATYRGMVRIPGMPTRFSIVSFGLIFAGTGYFLFIHSVISKQFLSYISTTGDVFNSTGISTAWSISYALLNFGKATFTKPRSVLPLGLACTVAANGVIYGQRYYREYFGLE